MPSVQSDISPRYPELDVLRGAAVLLMVAYHFLFDLYYFYGFSVPFFPSEIVARSIAALFLMIVGICSVISYERTPPNDLWKKVFRRAAFILTGATIITLATWIFDPETFVIFGILHLIGAGALLQPLFRPLRLWNLVLGAGIFLTILWLPRTTDSSLLIPFGLIPQDFFSLDYYPLLPWFGMILIGMGMGDLLYIPIPRRQLQKIQSLPYPKWLLWTGRRAILLYFLHQPVFLLVLRIVLG